MVKVTGRFPIRNIQAMIREFKSRKNLALSVDMVDHPIYDWLRLGWCGHSCRTIIYAVNLAFYRQHLYGRYAETPRRCLPCDTARGGRVLQISSRALAFGFCRGGEPCLDNRK